MFWNANETTVKFHTACIMGDLEKVNSLLRMDKEKIDLTQLDEMSTLITTVSFIKNFPSLKELKDAM